MVFKWPSALLACMSMAFSFVQGCVQEWQWHVFTGRRNCELVSYPCITWNIQEGYIPFLSYIPSPSHQGWDMFGHHLMELNACAGPAPRPGKDTRAGLLPVPPPWCEQDTHPWPWWDNKLLPVFLSIPSQGQVPTCSWVCKEKLVRS